MTLILRAPADLLRVAVFCYGRRFEIVDHRRHTAPEYLYAFFREALVADGEIVDCADRSVGKFQSYRCGIFIALFFRVCRYALGKDAHRLGVDEILHQIDEVTNFADNAASALSG